MPSEPTLRESIEVLRRLTACEVALHGYHLDCRDVVCRAAEAMEGLERLLLSGNLEVYWSVEGTFELSFDRPDCVTQYASAPTLPAAIAAALAAMEESDERS